MISDELKSLMDQFKEQGKISFFVGATEEHIASFEKDHFVVLPSKYKEWLSFSDGGDFFLPAGVQFYGIARKPVIDVDCNDRPSDKYIVLGALSTGDPILFEKGSEKIAIYNQEAERIEDDEIYDDFIAFLNDLTNILGIGG